MRGGEVERVGREGASVGVDDGREEYGEDVVRKGAEIRGRTWLWELRNGCTGRSWL